MSGSRNTQLNGLTPLLSPLAGVAPRAQALCLMLELGRPACDAASMALRPRAGRQQISSSVRGSLMAQGTQPMPLMPAVGCAALGAALVVECPPRRGRWLLTSLPSTQTSLTAPTPLVRSLRRAAVNTCRVIPRPLVVRAVRLFLIAMPLAVVARATQTIPRVDAICATARDAGIEVHRPALLGKPSPPDATKGDIGEAVSKRPEVGDPERFTFFPVFDGDRFDHLELGLESARQKISDPFGARSLCAFGSRTEVCAVATTQRIGLADVSHRSRLRIRQHVNVARLLHAKASCAEIIAPDVERIHVR